MDFDYSTETITPDNTNVLTIGGSGGLEIPVGTTAGRPGSPTNGLIRYNTDTGQIENYYSNKWASSIASIANRVIVQKNPGAGEFGSIASAVSSITGATITSPYEIIIYPGTYSEPEIVLPQYVNVNGSTEMSVYVEPLTATQNLFVMADNTSINFLNIQNVGSGYVGISANNIGTTFALCHKISMTNCDTGWSINSTTSACTVFLEYCDTTGGATAGVHISSSGGFATYANLENFYVYGDTTNPTDGIFITGPTTTVNIQTFGAEGVNGTNDGIHVQDGASVAIKAGHIFGWDIGLDVANVGAASHIENIAIDMHNNTTWDLLSEHPSATGTLTGCARKANVNTIASPLFTLAFSDSISNQFVQTGKFYLGDTSDTLTYVNDLIIETSPMGLITGGVISVNSGLTINITGGDGYLHNTSGIVTWTTWSAGTLTLPAGSAVYVYVNSSGVLSYSLSLPDNLTTILLGRVLTGASTIIIAASENFNISHYGNSIDTYLRQAVGVVYVSGSIVTENATTARSLDVTSGSWFYSIEHKLPSAGTGITFLDVYQINGSLAMQSLTQVDNTTYLSGGNLVSLTTGYFAKHTLYSAGEGTYQTYFMQHASAEYATLQEAIDAPLPAPLIDPTGTPHIAAIIVQQGVTNISKIIDIRPLLFGGTNTGVFGVSIHGNLQGLLADDHPQYLRTDGTRTLTGNLNLGTYNITNIGTANGVTIEAHASRHLPNGLDPITTAVAVTISNTSTNTVGIQNSLARSDHTHAITGLQPLNAALTALSSYNTNGILTQTAVDTFTGRTITGTTNRTTITDGDGILGNPVIDIASTYVGQTSITTLGSITTGVWDGTAVAANHGGTGQTTYAVGDILYADTTASLAKLSDIATGNALISGGINIAPSWGKVGLTTHISGVLPVANGGTELSAIPLNGQLLIGNGTNYTLASLTAGSGITITPAAGSISIAATNVGTVTSVGLSLPSIFTVTGSPVTTTGTLTGTLATQTANTHFTGPASGGAATPTFRTISLAQNDLSDVVITTPSSAQVLTYNSGTSKWVNSTVVAGSATGTVGVSPSGGGTSWTLISGSHYYADFVHNLGTTNVVITLYDTSDNSVVIANNLVATSTTTVRVTVTGNTKTIKVVVVANGQAIVAGGSTPSSVITAKDGVTISSAATKLNWIGNQLTVVDAGSGTTNITVATPTITTQKNAVTVSTAATTLNFSGATVAVTDAGAGVTSVNIGARYTYFASSLDTPVNSDFAVNSISPVSTDPTYISLNVRSFSNTIEQGVACLVSIPTGTTTMTVKMRGRAQTAPGVASVVQPRLYYRLLPNNTAVGTWSAAQELANISIPTNANFQYSTQTITLSTLSLVAGNLYQFELTRRVSGVTGTNLASNYLMAELTLEFA